MKKYTFIPDEWITFIHDGNYHIGRTLLMNFDRELIAAVSETGEMQLIAFNKASEIKKLKILKNLETSSVRLSDHQRNADFNVGWN
jgi:hypothetical protein